jgi:hypothetical protein
MLLFEVEGRKGRVTARRMVGAGGVQDTELSAIFL